MRGCGHWSAPFGWVAQEQSHYGLRHRKGDYPVLVSADDVAGGDCHEVQDEFGGLVQMKLLGRMKGCDDTGEVLKAAENVREEVGNPILRWHSLAAGYCED